MDEILAGRSREKGFNEKACIGQSIRIAREISVGIVLYSGRECAILDGFGGGICAMIDKQLEVYKTSNPKKNLPTAEQNNIKEKSMICDVQTAVQEKRAKRNPIEEFKKLDDTLEAFLNAGGNNDFDELGRVLDDLERAPVAQWTTQRTILGAGRFKIILLVDTQETAG